MNRRLIGVALFGFALRGSAAQTPGKTPAATIVLRRGLVITHSARVARRSYRIAASHSMDRAVIVIRGDNIVLDLNGATLLGAEPGADPDRRAGVAIRVDSGTNVTIKNGTIHGYRVNILARGTTKLTLLDLDVGESWKPRLYSLVEHESIADWLSFHHNEHGEWLRYGAGVYLERVRDGEISAVRAEQGMNGLLLTRCDSLRIRDNTLQFNSGLGIGMYRSSFNRIIHNRLDFNVRGYSNGVYSRGQDSADLLMFEQSSHNVVAYNSATHGGDGVFLWAGQSTMDTGEGGANDNLFFGNDLSFAPANAMEATFSRNQFVDNRAEGSDYGLWGGYSFESAVVGNCFVRNRVGVAIEHGQDNAIASNLFDGNQTAIRIWGDPIEPSDWGYPKFRDTDSRRLRIDGNAFVRAAVGMSVSRTGELVVTNNVLGAVDSEFVFADTAGIRMDSNFIDAAPNPLYVDPCRNVPALPAEFARYEAETTVEQRKVPSSPLSKRDRGAIIVDEWGPYDWRTPKLWPVDGTRTMPVRMAVLGPAGKWRLESRRGIAELSPISGKMNDTISVTPRADSVANWELTLRYEGARGSVSRGFSYGRFEPSQRWEVRIFAWSDSTDPRSKAGVFAALMHGAPLITDSVPRLDYVWYRPTLAGWPQAKWALEARSSVALAPGRYTLRTISDDGVRVWVDGVLAINDWTPHESTVDVAPLAAGRHELRVQYYQVDGWTELRLDIVRGTQRAGGSPGPH